MSNFLVNHCQKHNAYFGNAERCGACLRESQVKSADATQVGGSHYKDMAIQPWDVMQAVLTPEEFRGFLKGNVIKYSLRAGKKAGAGDDAEKAKHYAQKLREVQA